MLGPFILVEVRHTPEGGGIGVREGSRVPRLPYPDGPHRIVWSTPGDRRHHAISPRLREGGPPGPPSTRSRLRASPVGTKVPGRAPSRRSRTGVPHYCSYTRNGRPDRSQTVTEGLQETPSQPSDPRTTRRGITLAPFHVPPAGRTLPVQRGRWVWCAVRGSGPGTNIICAIVSEVEVEGIQCMRDHTAGV